MSLKETKCNNNIFIVKQGFCIIFVLLLFIIIIFLIYLIFIIDNYFFKSQKIRKNVWEFLLNAM